MNAAAGLALSVLWLTAELSVAVTPFDALGLGEGEAAALRRRAAELIGAGRRGRRAASLGAVDEAVAAAGLDAAGLRECLREPDCAARVARGVPADLLLAGSVAGLGGSFVLRLTLVDARGGGETQEVEGAVEGGARAVEDALAAQLDRLLPRERPWWRRWWPWTVLGLAVAAAAVATALALALDDDAPPIDVYPLP